VTTVAIIRDGRVVSASRDATLRVWDLHTGSELQRLEGHTDSVEAAVVTGDGRVISASEDRTLRVWDVDTGNEERIMRLDAPQRCLDAANGLLIAADGGVTCIREICG
jgi:WD40 repeat protein